MWRPLRQGPSLQHAQSHVFERVSVARDYEVLTEALRYGRGKIDTAALKGTLAVEEVSGTILREGSEIATAQSLTREREMIACVNRGVGSFEPLGADMPFTASDRLRPEQKRAVGFVLNSRDCAVGICGAAGAGKTATLQELRRGVVEAGRKVMAVAPTMSAVEELHKVGFSGAVTVERMLHDQQMQSVAAGSVIILDEAGMVSGRQMSELLQFVERSGSRVVFCGDTRQIQSVEACDALRVLEKESRLKSAALTEVQRQSDREYRDAIQELRRDPESGFQKLEQIGAVREVPWADRADAVAAAFEEANLRLKPDGRPRSVLVICATHEEIGRVTEAVRVSRKRAGQLGGSHRIARDVSLGWTAAQKSDWRNFRTGQVLGFHRGVKGIDKNETLEVGRADEEGVVARNRRGKERTVTRKQAQCFDVFYRDAIEVAAGERLLLTANRRQGGFRATNGEIVTVDHFDQDGRMCLDDGRIVPPDYSHLAHGYAVTAHRSQGKTVDAVIVSGDGMRKELFYVAASRGRDSVTIITSDAESLRETVARSAARQSATESARKAMVRVERGVRRGVAAARELDRYASRRTLAVQRADVWQEPKVERTHERGIGR
jgi:ATP-dependent exoDNAse (exonuclease V) alpha subunit